MMPVAAGLLFLLYFTLGALAAFGPGARRGRTLALACAYAVALSMLMGLVQRDAWPFVRWQIFGYRYDPPIIALHINGVDDQGQAHEIDHRAWEPIGFLQLTSWMGSRFQALPPDGRQRACAALLARAERARARAAAGDSIGTFRRVFGPFAAPQHFASRPLWSRAEMAPARRFTALRILEHRWDPAVVARQPDAVERRVIFECRP